jgi:hypothetical protein
MQSITFATKVLAMAADFCAVSKHNAFDRAQQSKQDPF